MEPTTTTAPNTLDCATILTCYKEHQTAIKHTVKQDNPTRYNKYGSSLPAMLILKPKDTVKFLLKTFSFFIKKDPTPTNLSSILDPEKRLITNNPTRVTTIIEKLETKSLYPDNRVNPPATFPWLHAIPAGIPSTKNMIIDNITPGIFQKALHQLPNHTRPVPG
jgi:hypothetical protein